MQDRVVIIGAGIAGVRAAEMLSPSFDVTLINNEPYLPYYRMRIEELLGGSGIEIELRGQDLDAMRQTAAELAGMKNITVCEHTVSIRGAAHPCDDAQMDALASEVVAR